MGMEIEKAESIFVIPARSGSKGIHDKNIQLIGGKTLIEHAVQSALASEIAGPIIVSSDSQRYLDFLPKTIYRHLRSQEASMDNSPSEKVIDELLEEFPSLQPYCSIIFLQPTSPFRKGSTVRKAWELHRQTGATVTSVFDIEPMHFEKFYEVAEPDTLGATAAKSKKKSSNRHSLKRFFYPNGAIYIFTVEQYLESNKIPVEGSKIFEMDRIESWDIDEPLDLWIAQRIGEEIV